MVACLCFVKICHCSGNDLIFRFSVVQYNSSSLSVSLIYSRLLQIYCFLNYLLFNDSKINF